MARMQQRIFKHIFHSAVWRRQLNLSHHFAVKLTRPSERTCALCTGAGRWLRNDFSTKTPAIQNKVPEIDLNFHVEFPPPGVKAEYDLIRPKENKGEGNNNNEQKQILVILLGWGGAQDKHLAKYSDLYLKRGCIILRYIVPPRFLYWDVKMLPLIGQRFVQSLRDLNLTSHPTFFHVFSNGGSFVYSTIIKAVAAGKNQEEFNFRGVIFDSAPAPRDLGSVFRSLANIFAGFSVFSYVPATLVTTWLICLTFYHHLQNAFNACRWGEPMKTPTTLKCINNPGPDPLQDWLTRIRLIQRHSFVFIYSDQDDLTAASKVEQTAQVLKARGNHVMLVKFDGSGHVQHYRAYPEEYVDAVTKFIRATMSRPYERPIFWDEAN